MERGFDLTSTYVHLGRAATATPVAQFEWSEAFLEAYERRFEEDGPDGRLVCVSPQHETWTTWERHPSGEEVVVLLTGRIDVLQEIDGVERRIELHPGEALINPTGAWHRSIVHEPGSALFITPGTGTEHRPVTDT